MSLNLPAHELLFPLSLFHRPASSPTPTPPNIFGDALHCIKPPPPSFSYLVKSEGRATDSGTDVTASADASFLLGWRYDRQSLPKSKADHPRSERHFFLDSFIPATHPHPKPLRPPLVTPKTKTKKSKERKSDPKQTKKRSHQRPQRSCRDYFPAEKSIQWE